MKRALASLSCLAIVSGCTIPPDIGRAPVMTPVGSGLTPAVDPLGIANFPPAYRASSTGSLYDINHSNLFRDPRAITVGDVLTVAIKISDQAKLGNSSDRTTTSKIANGADFAVGASSPTKHSFQLDSNTNSSATGTGNIDRSEQITLSVAVVVTGLLPDGNMVVSGSQEVRVNYELRELSVSGIVRPRDISKDNTISYDKIAEARISYGGRGRQSEVQQPGWGQQLYDAIKPF